MEFPPAAPAGPPDPEVAEKPKRRRFSAEYRLRIVREADACKEPGEIGALLRREGLYSSLLTAWRRQRDAGGAWRASVEEAGAEGEGGGPSGQASRAGERASEAEARAGGDDHRHPKKPSGALGTSCWTRNSLAGTFVASREEWPSAYWCV